MTDCDVCDSAVLPDILQRELHLKEEEVMGSPIRLLSRVMVNSLRGISACVTWARALFLGSVLLMASACGPAGVGADGLNHAVVPSFDSRAAELTLRKTDGGGVEVAVARDATDAAQVERLRAFLREQVTQFQRGHYQDPAKEHGMVMPGSQELEAAYSNVQVAYTDLLAGGEITYVASDPALVDALHAWFDRRELAR